MPLLRTRPKIRLRVPKAVFPGTPFVVDVLLDAKVPVDVDAVTASVHGHVTAFQQTRTIVHLAAHPSAPRPLPSGTTSLSIRVELPPGVPPSYAGRGLRVDWEVHVHASVPWWPDAHARFELHVEPTPSTIDDPTTLFATRADGPRSDEPYAELSLATRTMTPGRVLRGALACYGTTAHRYTRAVLTLRAMESVGGAAWEGPAWNVNVDLSGAGEGEPVPFAIGVPSLVPSFSTEWASLRWQLGVSISTMWSKVLAFDVPMYVAEGRPSAATRDALPPIGEERVRRIWLAIAEREGMRLEGHAIVRDVGAVRLAVHRGRGPRGGPELVATLTYPSLELDLSITERSLGARVFGQGAPTGVEVFDAAYVTRGRSASQTVRFVGGIAPALVALGVKVASADDTNLRLTSSDGGTTERPLTELVRRALRLATLFDEAIRALPLPPGLDENAAELEGLAESLGATLERGRARIAGTRDEAKVELTPVFDADGRATALRLEVTPEHGLRLVSAVEILDGRPPEDWPADAKRALGRVGSERLSLDAARAVAVLGGDPGQRIASVLPAIDALLALGLALKGGAGPFR